jgi:hypothetical protein
VGGCLALDWPLALVSVAAGLGIGVLTRNRFFAGVSAFGLSMVLMWWLLPTTEDRLAYLFAGGLVLLAHRSYFTKYFAP